GRDFPAELLAELLPDVEPTPCIQELVQEEFLVERHGHEQTLLTFRHTLTQEVAYESLLGVHCRMLHARAAASLERLYAARRRDVLDRLAIHYARSGQPEQAVECLAELADGAATRHSHAEAAKLLEEALRFASALTGGANERRRGEIVLALVRSLYFLGMLTHCRSLLVEHGLALQALGDPSLSARHRFWLAHTLSHLGDTEGADREAREAITVAELSNDD